MANNEWIIDISIYIYRYERREREREEEEEKKWWSAQCLVCLILLVYCTKYVCTLLSITYSSSELSKFFVKTNETA